MKEELDFTAPVMMFKERVGEHEFIRFTTTRHGGVSTGEYESFNLGAFCGDNPENVEKNRLLLCKELELDNFFLFIPHQVHGDKIFDINDVDFLLGGTEWHQEQLDGYDAIITNVSDLVIGITTADCAPVVFYDPVRKVIAAAHAGWRGTAKEIVCKVVDAMRKNHDCNVKNIKTTIFPTICGDIYKVGPEVIFEMSKTSVDVREYSYLYNNQKGEFFLDLVEANRKMLLNAGILPQNITLLNDCTYTWDADFFSARRQGYNCGRMVSGIVMKDLSLSTDENSFNFE